MSDQAKRLRQQFIEVNKEKKGKTVAIVSGKGGVGKSNFAVNFSLELLQKQKRVLLFDLDVGMGNIDILLGLHAEHTVIDMIENKLPVLDIIEEGPRGLAYVSGGTALTDFFTMDQQKRKYFYDQYQQLLNQYDYIIFDMGAGVTSDSMFFVLASDECIVITTPEPTSITDAYGMIKHIVNKRQNMPIYLVMNRCSSKKIGEHSLQKFQHVITSFLQVEPKSLGILPEDKMVSTAVTRQTPYIILNEKASISRALKEVVRHYIDGMIDQQDSRSASFLQRLTNLLKER